MKKIILASLSIGLFITACVKKVEPVDTFQVNVEFRQTGPKDIVGDITINPKDSIYLNFSISSPTDMSYVEIQKNGVRIDTFRLNNFTDKKNFSFKKGYMADSVAGTYRYRVLGRNTTAVFMGDGNKYFDVTITPDFNFWSARFLQVPDTVAKTNKCYYSSTEGKTYSFTDGAAKSALIDFGFYWDTTGKASSAITDDLTCCIYSLNAAQPQLNFYDINSWTKNTTLLKKMPNTINFVSQLISSGSIQTLIAGNMTSGTSSKVTAVSAVSPNNVIGFRTAAGKYGAILIRYVDGDSPAKTTKIEVDVKVQK